MPFEPSGARTFAGVPVAAIEDVMQCRMRQIVEFGHTPERDREAALYSPREFDHHGQRSLVRAIAAQLASAIEYASFGRGKYPIARRYLVKTAALCLAAIDWIDAELADHPPPD
ncbi:hypothetical protein [Novosphingobium colocasiae]|uniref:hypothetical protein n=1 Tax=Novosphingobium colocasiae TaxID=1256513 RepID=UPI0035B246A7